MRKSKITVLSVMGTRPDTIKMAPVIKKLAQNSARFRSVVCVTGQHRQMLDQVLDIFRIRPDFDLKLMKPDQSLSMLTSGLFVKLDRIVQRCRPDWILAQGDTTSTMVAAVVAFYNRIPFGHVEAGLRTHDLQQPFPEEMNRRTADMLANLLFAPTRLNRKDLLNEDIPASRIHVTGNTIVDALREITKRPFNWSSGPLRDIPRNKPLVLVTAHRRESFGMPLQEMCLAIRDLAQAFRRDGIQFVYPVHLNPNVRAPVHNIIAGIPNIHLIEPLDYITLIHLMKECILVLTDSGGIQEEAPSLRVPVLVMRDKTERPEGLEAGVAHLVGTHRRRITREAGDLLQNRKKLHAMAKGVNPYGDGKASARIVRILQANRQVIS